MILIIPAHIQAHLQDVTSAGWPLTKVFGFPGNQGITVFGIHGIGCNAPKLAAVAAATTGFANDRQSPKGAMLTNGLKSEILAIGIPAIKTVLSGSTVSTDGVIPIVHLSLAVETTYEFVILAEH